MQKIQTAPNQMDEQVNNVEPLQLNTLSDGINLIKTVNNHEQSDTLDGEQLIQVMGEFGRYQKLFTFIFAMLWMVQAATFLSPPILYQQVDLKCYDDQTNTYYRCTENNGGCDQSVVQVYDTTYNTMTSQFQLYCGRKQIRQYASVSVYLGGILGASVLSYLADNHGRRVVLIVGQVVYSLLTLLTPFIDNIYFQLINNFLISGILLGITNLHFTFVNESSGVKARQIIILILCSSFPIGSIIFTYLFQLLKDWIILSIIMVVIPSLLCNLQYFLIQETPLYLFQQQEQQQLMQTITKIAQINGRDKLIRSEYYFMFVQSENKEEHQSNYIDLFRYPKLRIISICCAISFFAAQNVYYGINFSLEHLGLGIYFNTIIVEVGELVGYFINYMIVDKIPRKKYSIILFGSVSILNIVNVLVKVPDHESTLQVFLKVIQVFLACLSKLVIAILFSLLQIYYPEIFPTEIRSQALGMIMAIGLIGVLVLPFIVDFANQSGFSPLIIISMIGLIGCLSLFYLNETHNKALPHTIKQIEDEEGEEDEEQD